jgi:micrococcal nuclease
MNIKPIIILVLILVSGALYHNLTEIKIPTETFQITKVIDGDTLETSTDQRLRLKGINTPEKSQLLADEATTLLQILAANQTITIENHGTDKYGRILAHAFTETQHINEAILQAGLAHLYYYEPDAHYDTLAQAEQFAQLNQKGIWKKSPNAHCITVLKFQTHEPEILELQNSCNRPLNITIKDEATHIYKETIKPNKKINKKFSHIWNDDGDTLFISDDDGLILFRRY